MSRILRVAILECETLTLLPKAKAARGSFGDIFHDFFAYGLQGLGPEAADVRLDVSKWDTMAGEYPRIEDVDVIALTGSYGTAFHNDPWIVTLVDFLELALKSTDKKIFGICFGHQVIGRALGADVNRNRLGWELSVEGVSLNDQGQELLGVPSLKLHQMHRDAVLTVPSGIANLGSSTKCPVQILYKPGRLLSFQGHPEFDELINEEIIRGDKDTGHVFDDETFQDALGRVSRPHDGLLMASRVMEFFLGSRKWNEAGESRST
ncbi:class I glutamine amidotransferase-like protein [Trichoderma citrinoviride]|uniref:Class I glutamine amidotransferase-like protein n=1 Tax=Trichoderma citrinoviride TaxID=58853 RepID=A0A2T4BMG6_9HYPO|nr:class I glutamine amidotransferase-like protein [Trichoderma citrinoviride]PTB70514.1 class I glutamine amidotransferase-like protein [Trichoderma citrinoviride]